MFIKQLATPVVIVDVFGSHTLTHEGLEITASVLAGGFIKATVWLGVMVPGTVTIEDPTPAQVFAHFEPSRVERLIGKGALKPLRDSKGGKGSEDCKLSDIYNLMYKNIVP